MMCPSFSLIKQDADVRKLHFSLSSRRRLAIKSKWLTLDSSVYNPSVPSWRSSLSASEKSSCWRSSTFWISGSFSNRSASFVAACSVLKLCCSKNQLWFNMSPKALEIKISFCEARNFRFEREILSQTVRIPSMWKNFVKADWFIGTSQIPACKCSPYSILNHIQPLNSNILFIVHQRKNLFSLYE